MKPFLLLVFILSATLLIGQESPIAQAEALIEEKKYESAYKILDAADPTNSNPEIAIAKSDLLLNYFITSFMHQMFALKDLEKGEDLMELRGSEGSFSMYNFNPDSVLLNLIEEHPTNYELKKELGFFYHDVHLKYPNSWLISDSLVVANFKNYYKEAYDNDVYDHWSTYGLGYAYLINQDYESSIPYFEKSIELKNDYPSSHYNLAYAYLYSEQKRKAIASAEAAMNLYDFPEYKSDAARMIAVIYLELEESEKAHDYYLQADKIQPDDYYNLKPLLNLEVALDKKTYVERTEQFFLLAPDNAGIYNDLNEIYLTNDKADALLDFYATQHAKYAEDKKVDGNLYFYTAAIHLDKEEHEKAKTNFIKAKEVFSEVFEEGHDVFGIIDGYLEEMR